MTNSAGSRLYPALFFTSVATLGFEVLLTRIFSIALWYHFGHMVVSIAMLGIGLSGTFYAVRSSSGKGASNPGPGLFLLLSASMVIAYLLAVRIPFDPVRLSWDREQLLLIGLYYVTLSLPFFFAGWILVSAFSAPGSRSGLVYGSDLLGAAAGCMAVFWVLWAFSPGEGIFLFALFPLIGAWLLGSRLARFTAVSSAVLGLSVAVLGPAWVQIPLSPYKELPTLLQFQGAEMLQTTYSPYGRIDLFRSPGVRYAPGLSLAYTGNLPAQTGLAVDGGAVTAVTPVTGSIPLEFLRQIPAAAAFELRRAPEVFILNPGGGLSVLLAQHYGSSHVDALEQNPAIVRTLSGTPALEGTVYPQGARSGFGRNHLKDWNRTYDILDVPLTGAVSSGGSGQGEAYGYTVEAFQRYLRGLKPDGMLSTSVFIVPPFRAELRILTTLVSALEAEGIREPQNHIVALRSLEVLLILAKPTPFKAQDLALLKEFAEKRWFDLVHYPGIRVAETRRFIKTDRADLTTAVSALMDRRTRAPFIEDYVFDISPTTDERPFFYDHLRFSRIPEAYTLVQKKWDFFIREGYLTAAVLLQLMGVGIVLTLVPAFVSVRKRLQGGAPALFFFACLGFGYMAVEVPLIQKLVLPLEHASTAFALTVGVLLVASGTGSLLGQRREPVIYLGKVLLVLSLLVIPAYVLVLPWFSELLTGIQAPWKVPALALFLFPLGVLMGLPFPAGMAITAERSPELVPWAWAVNGFLSVLTPVLSIVIAWQTGLGAVMLLGGLAYLLAYFASLDFWTSPVMGTKTTGVV